MDDITGRTTGIPVEMAETALAAYLAERGAVLTATDPDELDRIMVAIAAALEYAGIKRVRRGQYAERWESRWERTTDKPQGDDDE